MEIWACRSSRGRRERKETGWTWPTPKHKLTCMAYLRLVLDTPSSTYRGYICNINQIESARSKYFHNSCSESSKVSIHHDYHSPSNPTNPAVTKSQLANTALVTALETHLSVKISGSIVSSQGLRTSSRHWSTFHQYNSQHRKSCRLQSHQSHVGRNRPGSPA
jgi:hypothetical protein